MSFSALSGGQPGDRWLAPHSRTTTSAHSISQALWGGQRSKEKAKLGAFQVLMLGLVSAVNADNPTRCRCFRIPEVAHTRPYTGKAGENRPS